MPDNDKQPRRFGSMAPVPPVDVSRMMGGRVDLTPPTGGLSEFHPSVRDRVAQFLIGNRRLGVPGQEFMRGVLGSTGLGKESGNLIDWTPLGMPLMSYEAGQQLGRGDPEGAAETALNMAGGVPGRVSQQAFRGLQGLRSVQWGSLPGIGLSMNASLHDIPFYPPGYSFRNSAINAARQFKNPHYGRTASDTFEQVPGKSTGLAPDLANAPYSEKEAFSSAAPWPSEPDPIYHALGLKEQPPQSGKGIYTNSAGEPESNPVTIGRPNVRYQRNAEGNLGINPEDVTKLNAGSAVRGLMDFQEGAAWNKIIHGRPGAPGQTSVSVALGRQPSDTELQELNDVATKHGFVMANSHEGVNFLNFDPEATTELVGAKLSGELGKDIRDAVPQARALQGSLNSGYTDYSQALARENAGKGLATRQMVEQLEALRKSDPDAYDAMMHSSGIAKKASANLNRLDEFGLSGQRPDYETMLGELDVGSLRGLMDRIKTLGYAGLPVAAGAAALGSQAPNPDEPASQQ